MYYVLIFSMLLLLSHPLSPSLRDQFIVWNVGQGQWITWTKPNECWHFDSGGEYVPHKSLIEKCKNKKQRLFLTHLDWDHLNFIEQLKKLGPHCWFSDTTLINTRKYAHKISKIPTCDSNVNHTNIKIIHQPTDLRLNSNSLSRVFVVNSYFLISGDSPQYQEKRWAQLVSNRIRIFVLGHHGSQTSTSDHLLNKIDQTTVFIASQRAKKYGHPHFQVEWKLLKRNRRILKTEDWGNISIEMPPRTQL